MKRLNEILNWKTASKIIGTAIGLFAIYFSLKNINGDTLKQSLDKMNTAWLLPIILGNFLVILLKAIRWQIILKPIKEIKLSLMYRVLIIGFMANNILPARMGEAIRIHLIGRDAEVSILTTTATLVADRIIESTSFLIIAALLVISSNVPKWMHSGLTITLLITVVLYTAAIIYSTRHMENKFLKRFQDGIQSLLHVKLTLFAFIASFLSWFMQGIMLYMTQLAFGIHPPLWGIVLVVIAINLAIALPSAPANLGTFEFACILAYTYLGIDKSVGLVVGLTYHLLQVLPVTLVGGLIILTSWSRGAAVQPVKGHY